MGDRLDAVARVADRRDEPAGLVVDVVAPDLERVMRPRPGLGQEGVGLGRRARLRSDEDQGLQRIQVVEDRRDGRGIGRIEDPQRGIALLRPEGPVEHVRGKAAPAHAGHDRGGIALVDDGIAEPLEGGDLVGEVGRCVEPAQALGDGCADPRVIRPERHVAVVQAVGPLLGARSLHGRLERRGSLAQGEPRDADQGRGGIGHDGYSDRIAAGL